MGKPTLLSRAVCDSQLMLASVLKTLSPKIACLPRGFRRKRIIPLPPSHCRKQWRGGGRQGFRVVADQHGAIESAHNACAPLRVPENPSEIHTHGIRQTRYALGQRAITMCGGKGGLCSCIGPTNGTTQRPSASSSSFTQQSQGSSSGVITYRFVEK